MVSGGIGCLAVLGFVSAKMPELRRYRIGTPHLQTVDTQIAEAVEEEESALAAGGS